MSEVLRGIMDAYCESLEDLDKWNINCAKERILKGRIPSPKTLYYNLDTQRGLYLVCKVDSNGCRYNIIIPESRKVMIPNVVCVLRFNSLLDTLNKFLDISLSSVISKFGSLEVCFYKSNSLHLLVGVVDDTIVFMIKLYGVSSIKSVMLSDNIMTVNSVIKAIKIDISDYHIVWG